MRETDQQKLQRLLRREKALADDSLSVTAGLDLAVSMYAFSAMQRFLGELNAPAIEPDPCYVIEADTKIYVSGSLGAVFYRP